MNNPELTDSSIRIEANFLVPFARPVNHDDVKDGDSVLKSDSERNRTREEREIDTPRIVL